MSTDTQRRDAGLAKGSGADDAAIYARSARAWLARHASGFSGAARHGLTLEQDLALGRAWQKLKCEHGYAAISMPREYGGGGGSELEQVLFAYEELRYDLPTTYFGVSLGMPVPMLLRYAPDAILRELVPPAVRGEQIWCQLFSEPAAGSDLAALTLRATREDDGWRLDGQKLWTTWAQFADWGVLVARHDPTVAKHAGLTYFYVDMKARGVQVRPIRKLAGPSEICEVFFDGVVVPDSQRLGAVGAGFKLALETLMIERYAVSDESCWGSPLASFIEVAARARIGGRPALEDGEVRRAIADAVVERQGLRSIHRRAMAAIADGREPGPEGSIRKLLLARRRQRLGALAIDLLGADGVRLARDGHARTDPAWSWLEAPPLRIAGGSDEVLRNTIAERVLGLPQDHRPDKGVPFNQLR